MSFAQYWISRVKMGEMRVEAGWSTAAGAEERAEVWMGMLRESAVIIHAINTTANMGSEKRDKQPLPSEAAAVCR
jgi:hypothetical protein